MLKDSRRSFLRTSAAASVSPFIVPLFVRAETKGANDRIRIAGIGTGGRGSYVSGIANQLGDGEIIMVCDADLRKAEAAKKRFKRDNAVIVQDYRKVLDNKDIDVIINGTPDHWHTKINAEACRAGKDVYCEKPMTLTIEEGKLLRQVVKDTKRIVQIGTQQRSSAQFQTAVELIRAGRIGKVTQVYISIPYYQTKGGPFPKEDVPQELNWDLFQGQAPEAQYCSARVARWRLWYEYSGGNTTDWGNHHTDIALWGLNADNSGPLTVEARAIYPNEGKTDCYSTPGAFFSKMKFSGEVEVLFFASIGEQWKALQAGGKPSESKPAERPSASKPTELSTEQIDYLFGKDCPEEVKATDRDGVMFIGDKGRIFVNRGGVFGKPVDELKDNPLPESAWKVPFRAEGIKDKVDSTWRHIQNFFDCVKSRQQPAATVELEQRAVTLCHLTNISIRSGRKIQWNPVTEQITGDNEAGSMQGRKQREPYTVS